MYLEMIVVGFAKSSSPRKCNRNSCVWVKFYQKKNFQAKGPSSPPCSRSKLKICFVSPPTSIFIFPRIFSCKNCSTICQIEERRQTAILKLGHTLKFLNLHFYILGKKKKCIHTPAVTLVPCMFELFSRCQL